MRSDAGRWLSGWQPVWRKDDVRWLGHVTFSYPDEMRRPKWLDQDDERPRCQASATLGSLARRAPEQGATARRTLVLQGDRRESETLRVLTRRRCLMLGLQHWRGVTHA